MGRQMANGRWLAAPLITHRIGDGVLAFTPDMSRAEADQFVLGLNNVAQFYRINPNDFPAARRALLSTATLSSSRFRPSFLRRSRSNFRRRITLFLSRARN